MLDIVSTSTYNEGYSNKLKKGQTMTFYADSKREHLLTAVLAIVAAVAVGVVALVN